DYSVKRDHNEVDEVFEVPLDFLLDPQNLYSDRFALKNHRHRVFALPYKQHFIWGMTAQIIQSLQKQIFHHHQ
ncbi:MAG: CoA pyrophosphatase, partial [Vibrio sp.]